VSSRISSVISQIWSKLGKSKEYREEFVSSRLSMNIPAQIRAMREDRGWTQKQLADAAGMAQARISLMEDPSYDKYTLSTLKRLAAAFDVALLVEYVRFSDLVRRTCDYSPEGLAPPSYADDRLPSPAPAHAPTSNLDQSALGPLGQQHRGPGETLPVRGGQQWEKLDLDLPHALRAAQGDVPPLRRANAPSPAVPPLSGIRNPAYV
jgi:transcriptional regulator with XRE-family HTH domain